MRHSILPTVKRSPWQFVAHLWSGDQTFRGFLEFALIGAVVLAFLHGLNLNVFKLRSSVGPGVPQAADVASEPDHLRSWRLPTLADVTIDTAYVANKPEPLRRQLAKAILAIRAKDLLGANDILSGIDADDPAVVLVRAIVAVASPDPAVFQKGFGLLEQSASRGEPKAMAILGVISLVGHGGQSRNVEAGRQHLQQAADAGDAKAAYVLASGYITGWAGRVDLAAGARLLRRAAERGDTEAMFQYAIMLIKGTGVEKNAVEGETWMLRAAELGHPGAQSEFGSARLTDYLHQVTTDAAPAVAWLSRAAEQGETDAMFRLGIFYERAKPSTGYSDPERGVALLKKCSEEALDDRCTFAYATMLESGHGVAIDLVRAYAFYRLSEDAKKTPRGAERLASLEKQLQVEELKNGRELARQVRERFFTTNLPPTTTKFSPVPSRLSGQ
jgi:TPR repeat protein